MAIDNTRYKLIYDPITGELLRVIEIRDANGVVLTIPIVHVPTDPDWATFLASLDTCITPEDNIRCVCLCDDTTDDGLNIVQFIRVVAINVASGTASTVGDFTLDYSSNYTTLGTVSVCSEIGTPVVGLSQGRELLNGITGWSKPSSLLQSVGVRAVTIGNSGDPPTITDYRSVETALVAGEAFETWEVYIKNNGEILVGDFTVTTKDANDKVIITWTELTT